MQNFDASAFLAMPAAKAKVAALALFDAAMIEPAADWRGVAFALHAVVSRKRGKAVDDIAMADSADAGEFTEWADYAATGKAANIARGRVTVTFADGWTRTVGMLAGKTAKGRKPWSIAHAVRFAVLCYKLAAARRATGSDAVMYFDRDGNASGSSIALNSLIAAPEIVSVISADSAETVEGDLIWNPCEANAFTLDLRSGSVAVPLALAPMPGDIADALKEARHALLIEMGLIRSTMRDLSRAAYDRVCASLYPAAHVETIYSAPEEFFAMAWGDNADAYPMAGAPVVASPDPADESPAEVDSLAVVPPQERAPADLETMVTASEIVRESAPLETQGLAAWHVAHNRGDDRMMPDDWAYTLSPVTYMTRFTLIEDALLAWPALAVVADTPAAPAGVEDAAPATHAAPMPQTPARKPRYRYSSLSGRWEPISEAAPALGA